jgi:hypothetical protein
MSLRASLLWIIGGLIGVIAVYTGYWLFARSVIEGEVRDWIAEQEAAGYFFEADSISVGGYPYRFTVRIEAPDMQAPESEGGWHVNMTSAVAHAPAINFAHWIVSFDGPIILQLGPGAQEVYRVDAALAAVSIIAGSDGRTKRVGAEINDLSLESLEGPAPLLRAISSLRLSGEVMKTDEMRTTLYIEGMELDPAELGPESAEAFGETAERFGLNMTVNNWGALASEGDVMAWREAGGAVEIDRAELIWGPARLSGDSGEFSLGETAQVNGALSIDVADPENFIDALAEAGILQPDFAPGLRLAATMARRGREGVSLRFRMQEGRPFLGPVPLGPAN